MDRPPPLEPDRCPAAWDGLLSRRDLLRVGSLGVAGSLLPFEVPSAQAKPTTRCGTVSDRATARSVIVLWMAGGLTHIDSFDPKPDAPSEVRGTLGAINTSLVGVRFCETMPCLARAAKHIALVRSFGPENDDHFVTQAYALSGRRVTPAQITTEPNVGSLVARL